MTNLTSEDHTDMHYPC